MHPRFLTDSFRLLRSSIVGFVTTLALIQVFTVKEAFTVSDDCADLGSDHVV